MCGVRVCGCAVVLALCFLGTINFASTASLQNEEKQQLKKETPEAFQREREQVLRKARSTLYLNPIVANVPGGHQGVSQELVSKVYQPEPVKITSADGTTTALQLVFLVLTPPATQSQCQPIAAPAPSLNFQPVPPAPSFVPPVYNPPTYLPYEPKPAYTTEQYAEESPSTTSRPSRRRQRPTTRVAPQPTATPTSSQVPVVPQRTPSVERKARRAPTFPPSADTQLLLQQFRAQVAKNPLLPPVVTEPLTASIDDTVLPENNEVPVQPAPTSPPAPLSPQPAPHHQSYYPQSVNHQQASPFPQPGPYPASGQSQSSFEQSDRCIGTCKQRLQTKYTVGGDGGGGSPDPHNAGDHQPSPPLPRFDRSMMLRAVLTVPSADYSEPYTVWWDAASGASRIDYHGDTASTYRIMRLDGLVQSVQVRVDRTGESDVRRCVTLTPRRVSLAERALPVLPDLTGFTFAGYIEVPIGGNNVPARVERWRHSVTGEGAVPQEVLTFRHELLVARAPDNYTTTPLRYAVAVDSSILGDNSDTYSHRFTRVQTHHHDPAMFQLDIGDACETIETTEQIDMVEPLREFTMLQRNPRHAANFQDFKKLYQRTYADNIEESVRKNVLMQASRFVSSGNRKGASFELETNFLSDRLDVEKQQLLGSVERFTNNSQPFPHSAEELSGLKGRLPRTFDWRKRGAVTSVRYQDTCSSCWAFSVVGAVEGALFVNTGRLVPLSEQSLVDCGKPYGANGCNPTWPVYAYDYVQDQGLPALDEYPAYTAKVQQCKAAEVPAITRISGHVNVTTRNIVALKVAIRRHGPTVVLVDAQTPSFIAHKSGYYHDAKCQKKSSNHAMLAVGWTVHRGETYFILKNSWSAAWGDEGYINVRASTNTCGVLRKPSYPILKNSDVLRIPASAATAVTPPSGKL